MSVLESAIERKVCRDAKRVYGIHNIKLNGRGQTGWLDRMFILDHGQSCFIEFKRPGGKVSPKQEVCIQILKNFGHRVAVIDNYDDGMRFLLWAQNDTRL